MSYEGTSLEDGYAYLEITELWVNDSEGNQLTSKNGHPMVKVKWKAVDISGNSGNIYDYVPANIDWKIRNLQNALNIKGLYDQKDKKFNTSLLDGGHCAGVIKRDTNNPKYFKIDSYIPLEFFVVVQKHKKEDIKSNIPVQSTPVATSVIDDDFDDIPF